jgi:TDG/mug DNA glycosylase family protein
MRKLVSNITPKAPTRRTVSVPDITWAPLRLKDRIKPGVRVLFVGINPGVRSALTGHHFAGFSNRFWKLLSESRLVPEPITYVDDDRLPDWGFGITNLIARPSPGINDLRPPEYLDGWKLLERKIRRYRPEVLALVGVTLFRAVLPLIDESTARVARPRGLAVGPLPITVHGARIFVLPNPSGRNANFSYAEMLDAFRRLKEELYEGQAHGAPCPSCCGVNSSCRRESVHGFRRPGKSSSERSRTRNRP